MAALVIAGPRLGLPEFISMSLWSTLASTDTSPEVDSCESKSLDLWPAPPNGPMGEYATYCWEGSMGRACTQGSKETPRTRPENEVGESGASWLFSVLCPATEKGSWKTTTATALPPTAYRKAVCGWGRSLERGWWLGGWFALLSALLSLLFYLCRYFAFLLYSYCSPLSVVQQLGPSKLQGRFLYTFYFGFFLRIFIRHSSHKW